VLPFCIINAILGAAIGILRDEYDVDASIQIQGHITLSRMIAFLVVTRVRKAYDNFWEARTRLSLMLSEARSIAVEARSFTCDDINVKAQLWRSMLCEQLEKLVTVSIDTLMQPDKTAALILNTPASTNVHPDENPMERIKYLMTAITLHREYLNNPLIIHKEVRLQERAAEYVNKYRELAIIASTPYPFPVAQLARIFILIWLFSLPFALADKFDFAISAFLAFFITYGFFGLEFVSIELDDPFGTDRNDIEMVELTKVTLKGIRNDLKEWY